MANTMDFMKMFLTIGDLTDGERTLEEKVAYDTRIVFATMRNMIPDWEAPRDWDQLTLEQKDERLTKLKEVI